MKFEIRGYFLFYNPFKMSRKRRNYPSHFKAKAKVAMAAIYGDEALSELARRYNSGVYYLAAEESENQQPARVTFNLS